MKMLKQIILVIFLLAIQADAQFSYLPNIDEVYDGVIAKISHHSYTDARLEIENILVQNKNNEDIQKAGYFLKGFTFFIEKKFSEAISSFNKALELTENINEDKNLKARSSIMLAECYNQTDNTSKALEIYNGTIEEFSDDKTGIEAVIKANNILGSTKSLNEANSYLNSIIAKYKGKGAGIAAQNLLGQNYISEEDYANAILIYKKIISENTEDIDGSWAKLKLGEVYLYGLNDNGNAKLIFQEIVNDNFNKDITQLANQHLFEIASLEN